MNFLVGKPLSIFLLLCVATIGFSVNATAQAVGIFQTYLVLEVDTPGNVWLAGNENADNAMMLDSATFENSPTITIKGAEIKSWKNNGGDVTGAILYYNVHLANETVGTFREINLPWAEDLQNAGDQRWENLAIDSTITSGLADGNYELEVFWKITTSIGDRFDNNGGNNFKASFTIGTPIGVVENSVRNEIKVFPNPCINQLRVSFSKEIPQKVEIVDLTGKVQQTQAVPFENRSILVETGTLKPGMYFIRYYDENGNSATEQFMVAN